ncbi:MAG: hypothetical protein OXP71_09030 [Candidatus Poribacteria bacterium]|nr:hypothetical protein [Candidatus Poribacteria bacterium]
MRELRIRSGVMNSGFIRVDGGFFILKTIAFAIAQLLVGFRAACIDSSSIRNSERLIAT